VLQYPCSAISELLPVRNKVLGSARFEVHANLKKSKISLEMAQTREFLLILGSTYVIRVDV
jgi:hypothetical protein